MREAADTRSYAAALSVLVVAEWLYLDWASRAPQPLPNNFVHAEWITLHDNSNFRGFVDFLRTELDRVGPAHADLCRDFFSRAVALELSFFEAAYTSLCAIGNVRTCTTRVRLRVCAHARDEYRPQSTGPECDAEPEKSRRA